MSGNEQSFGEWLRTLRGNRSQEEFATSLKIDQSYLGRIERGDRPPTEMLCIQVARATGVKLSEVLERAGFSERGEFDDDITEEEHEFHRSLARFKDPASRQRAISAALAVLDSLAAAESKGQRDETATRRAPARRPATG